MAIIIPIRSNVRQVPDHFGEWQVKVWYREDKIMHAWKKIKKCYSNSVHTHIFSYKSNAQKIKLIFT